MKRSIFYLTVSILFSFLASSYTLAMMGGGGGIRGGHMGGGMGGGTGYGGQYGNQAPYSDYNRQQPRYNPRYNREAMDRNTAEGLARNYIVGRYGDAYHLGGLKDHDTYYMAEIRGPRGNLSERLLIDKQTGNIHSLQ